MVLTDGEHTREVLLEHGYSEAEVDALADEGTLGPTPKQLQATRDAAEARRAKR